MDNYEHQKECICAWCEVDRQNAEIRRDRDASSRYEAIKADQTYRRLAAYPHQRAEAIANHYTKLASIAMDLRKMTELCKHSDTALPEMSWAIRSIVEKIAEQHREDFGIELSWMNSKSS